MIGIVQFGLGSNPVTFERLLLVQETGFEPAKHYAVELESTPFDHLGYSCLKPPKVGCFVTLPILHRGKNPRIPSGVHRCSRDERSNFFLA